MHHQLVPEAEGPAAGCSLSVVCKSFPRLLQQDRQRQTNGESNSPLGVDHPKTSVSTAIALHEGAGLLLTASKLMAQGMCMRELDA